MNLPVEERDITVSELFMADEVFGTGTGSEISPVIEINGRIVGEGKPGHVTNRMEGKLRDFIGKTGTSI